MHTALDVLVCGWFYLVFCNLEMESKRLTHFDKYCFFSVGNNQALENGE